MELDYRLNCAQEAQVKALTATAKRYGRSWLLQRIQGTGLKFWRITVNTKPDWAGDNTEVDGLTLTLTIQAALRCMEGR